MIDLSQYYQIQEEKEEFVSSEKFLVLTGTTGETLLDSETGEILFTSDPTASLFDAAISKPIVIADDKTYPVEGGDRTLSEVEYSLLGIRRSERQQSQFALVNTYGLDAKEFAEFGPSYTYSVDPFSLATRIYSLRRINKNYTGPCLRVRRAIDNAELDIGWAGNEVNVAQLLSFCAGDDGFIVTYYDQQGNGNAFQVTAGSQPLIVKSGSLRRVWQDPISLDLNPVGKNLSVTLPNSTTYWVLESNRSDTQIAQITTPASGNEALPGLGNPTASSLTNSVATVIFPSDVTAYLPNFKSYFGLNSSNIVMKLHATATGLCTITIGGDPFVAITDRYGTQFASYSRTLELGDFITITSSNKSAITTIDIAGAMSGSLPNFPDYPALTRFAGDINNTAAERFCGFFPSLSSNTSLQIIEFTSTGICGRAPSLTSNTALTSLVWTHSFLSGTPPTVATNTLLTRYQITGNEFSGNIPSFSSNTALVSVLCENNQLTGFAGGTISGTLTNFLARNNALSQSAVNAILVAIDNAGSSGPGRTVTLNLGTNAAPNGAGLTSKANLISRGWTVLTN